MEIITIIFFALAALVLLMAVLFVVMFYRPIGGYDVTFNDDTPARYEDFEEAFYNP